MVRLSLVLFLTQIVLAVIALIGCLSADAGKIRALPRLIWLLVILFLPLVGAIAWFLAGRPAAATGPGGRWRISGGPFGPDRRRPPAPDDDPEFLRSIGTERSAQDRALFEHWESDLRRNGDNRRHRDAEEPPREEDRPQA